MKNVSEQDAKLAHAIMVLMEAAENAGRPAVALDIAEGPDNYYRLVVSMNGRKQDVEEVITLMQRKYPNAGIMGLNDIREERELSGEISIQRGDA